MRHEMIFEGYHLLLELDYEPGCYGTAYAPPVAEWYTVTAVLDQDLLDDITYEFSNIQLDTIEQLVNEELGVKQ